MADALDAIINAHAEAGPSRPQKQDVTYDDFQSMLDNTPLFMKATPQEGVEDDGVLEALRSLVFEGDGDGA